MCVCVWGGAGYVYVCGGGGVQGMCVCGGVSEWIRHDCARPR
jgi:hypothetical protein